MTSLDLTGHRGLTQRLAGGNLGAIILLVAVGAYTRGTADAMVEGLHRGLAMLVGLLALGTVAAAWRHHRSHPGVLWPAGSAFLVIGVQGWLGRLIVTQDITADLVPVHLAISMTAAALVTVTFVNSGPVLPLAVPDRPWTIRVTFAAAASALVLLLGGYVHDLYVSGWPLVGNRLVPRFTSLVLTAHYAHRVVVAVLALLLARLAVIARRSDRGRTERLLVDGAAGAFVLNIGLGAAHVATEVGSSPLIALHLLMASLVWTQLIAVLALSRVTT